MKEAIADCTAFIAETSADFSAYLCRGLMYDRLKDSNAARTDFERCIKLNEGSKLALYFHALASNRLDKPQDAVADFSQLIKMDPKHKSHYLRLRANALYELGKNADAMEDRTKAIELSPAADVSGYLISRGSAYRKQKQFAAALEDFTSSVEAAPEKRYAYSERAETFVAMGQFNKAVKQYSEALERTDPNHVGDVYFKRAQAYSKQEQFLKAASDYEKAIEARETYYDGSYEVTDARLAIAAIGFKAGDFQSATQQVLMAVRDHRHFETGLEVAKWCAGILGLLAVLAPGRFLIRAKVLLITISMMLLLIGIGECPYDYYTLMRFVVCPVSAFTAYRFFTNGRKNLGSLFAALAVLFNPVLQVHLEAGTWAMVDLLAAFVHVVAIVVLGRMAKRDRQSLVPAPHEVFAQGTLASASQTEVSRETMGQIR